MIPPQRIRALNEKPVRKGDYVLYWMQASQRAECNHALQYAVRRANELRLPIVVFFGLTAPFPEANERAYAFMLEGLAEVRSALEKIGIRMVARAVPPDRGAAEMAERAALAVVDRGYLRIQKSWRAKAAAAIECHLLEVESDVVVPVGTASPKEEYSAATFRPKVRALWKEFLVPLRERKPVKDSSGLSFESLDLNDIDGLLGRLDIDRGVGRSPFFKGGTAEAMKRLRRFLRRGLSSFAELRNIPTLDGQSHLSPYLHFGQISPLRIALLAMEEEARARQTFLDELLVRRELSMNFVHYNAGYDDFSAVPGWARKTLEAHARDARPAVYDLEELENGRTADPYWNAAQNEMRIKGKMHGYMRMYWGKKILEWTPRPEDAFRLALRLNNKYEIDGRDPNGFAGVAWCFGKHDRPWGERAVFGSVRSMTAGGLCRKFDADAYVRLVEGLSAAPKS